MRDGFVDSILVHEQRVPVEGRGSFCLFLDLLLLLQWQLGDSKFVEFVLSLCSRRNDVQQPTLEGLTVKIVKGFRGGIRIRILN